SNLIQVVLEQALTVDFSSSSEPIRVEGCVSLSGVNLTVLLNEQQLPSASLFSTTTSEITLLESNCSQVNNVIIEALSDTNRACQTLESEPAKVEGGAVVSTLLSIPNTSCKAGEASEHPFISSFILYVYCCIRSHCRDRFGMLFGGRSRNITR